MKSQLETGLTPSIEDKELGEAFETYNLLQTGFSINLEEVSIFEVKLVSLIESVKNEVQQKSIEKDMQEARNQW